ncbi:MAG: helicase-exonuclease AddAB subunit AddA [Lactobacillus sp.]|nr:helicase-exonuclease AddAB subunit AddA [Lactobacillus sp.]
MPFTKEQQAAMDCLAPNILVSASAGSGKTTVLVERVLKLIKNGINVDELLIVTFTNAAALEMKTRLKLELTKLAAEDDRFKTQLTKLESANISTIDAFCLQVLKRFYYCLDLDPSFSLLTDETQAELLREEALGMIEKEKLNDPAFLAFYDNFSDAKDSQTARELLLSLYNFAMTKANYREWLKELPRDYEVADSLVKTELWQKKIKAYLYTSINELSHQLALLSNDPHFAKEGFEKLVDRTEKFKLLINNYLTSLKTDQPYNEQRANLAQIKNFNRVVTPKKMDELDKSYFKQMLNFHKVIIGQAKDLYSSFYATDEAQQIEVMHQGQQIVETIYQVELAFIKQYQALKKRNNLLDFTDLEQLTSDLFTSDTTESAMSKHFYQQKFKEVLVDEYQDINPLQESILTALKADNRSFVVGDVKQSIYGFRQAEPQLFLAKYQSYQASGPDTKIILKDNFRSTTGVVNTVNQIFNPLMTENFGGIDYQKEGQLVFGASYYPSDLDCASELYYSEDEFSQIDLIVNRIKKLIAEKTLIYDVKTKQKRPIEYRDIVLLERGRGENLEIIKALEAANIPVLVSDTKNYFQTTELTIIMSYLKIIDNPIQDIPLVAVMRSPLYNFSENDLARIRVYSKRGNFYQAVTKRAGEDDDLAVRLRSFLNELSQFRAYANAHRISELIWHIYEETDLLELMTQLPGGAQRRVNLEALFDRAKSYETAGFKGIFQFINFISRMQERQKDLAQPIVASESNNCIQLMTIHGSKGLEFPVVFYLGLNKRFQKSDLYNNYIINQSGLGITITGQEWRINTLVKSYGNFIKTKAELEEETRVLYVALTRAKQKLIIPATFNNLDNTMELINSQRELGISLQEKLAASTPLKLIAGAMPLGRDSQFFKAIKAQAITQDQTQNLAAKPSIISYDLDKFAKKMFDFQYDHQDATEMTSYQSVSEVKASFSDDETELENAHLIKSHNHYLQPIEREPNFLYKENFTGAEIGSATHLVLQYYQYDHPEISLEAQIQALVDKNLLQAELAKKLPIDAIKWFLASDFAKPFYQNPEQLFREESFSSTIKADLLAHNFSDPDAKVLIHGTIDGYFVTKNGIILFDYKTDHVDRKNQDLAIKKLQEKYQGQLRLYEKALSEFSQKSVIKKYLILLDCQQIVPV